MLSIKRCREIIGRGSDVELELVREQLYALADVAVSAFMERQAVEGQRRRLASVPFSDALNLLPSEDGEDVEERAAIIEFEGRKARDEAEREAFLATVRRHKTTCTSEGA